MAKSRSFHGLVGAILVGLVALWAVPGHAADFPKLLADIAGESFNAKIKACVVGVMSVLGILFVGE